MNEFMAQYTFKKNRGVDIEYNPLVIYDVYRVVETSTKKYTVRYIGTSYPLYSHIKGEGALVELDIVGDWYPLDADKFFENTFE